MRNVYLFLFICFMASCSSIQNDAEKQLRNTIQELARNPETFKILDLETVYKSPSDSLIVLSFTGREELDEDLSFEGFFKQKKSNELYDLFMAHPEINASAVARRLGISQSLLAQYIGGTKKPSAERLERIKSELRHIGEELLAI